jgi:predicted ArsR family transcriptional regulator
MQHTRRHILTILRENGEATVDEIVTELQKVRGKDITAVTVRHHLTKLQQDDLITTPQLRHRSKPGRPQHVYALTERAQAQFPNNYQQLAVNLIKGMRQHLPPEGVNVIIEDVAQQLASSAEIPDVPLVERLDFVVGYLDKQGYRAHWELCEGGYLLHTTNCPYHKISEGDQAMCDMDMRLIATLLGVVPRRVTHIASGDQTCAYMIPSPVNNAEERLIN